MSNGEDAAVIARPEGGKSLSHSRKSAKKRDAILRAAIDIINAKSFALATMTEIAAALDLRDAALYYYFPNKQALVFACHMRSLERFEILLRESDRMGGTGAVKLRRFLRELLNDTAREGPQLYFGDHSYLDAPQRCEIDAWTQRLIGEMERFLEEGMADGSVVPCEGRLVVQLLLGMLIWSSKWAPAEKGLTADRLMEAIDVVALRGLEAARGARGD